MLEISTAKVAHVIVRAREYDEETGSWEDAFESGFREDVSDSMLENIASDSTRSELMDFIGTLNIDEQASLVALAWLGRGTYQPEQLDDAIEVAKSETLNKTETYLIGIPLLADYLEEGLDKLGYSVEEFEKRVV